MKITIFANGVSYGGAEHVACNLANYFVAQGYEIDLLTMADELPTYELTGRANRIPLIYKKERKGFFYNLWKRLDRLNGYIQKTDTDCYIAFCWVAVLALLRRKKELGVPVILSERTNPFAYPSWLQLLLKIYSARADFFVFQTSGQKDFYRKYLNRRNFARIPNAVETGHAVSTWEERGNVVVAAGRLHKVKNFAMLIAAFAKSAGNNRNYRLVIYGEGKEQEHLERQIEKLHLEKRILLAGYSKDLAHAISHAKIFAMASDYEGMPNALLEAMSVGLACIATDCPTGGPRNLITNGENGILTAVGDMEKMSEALSFLMEHDDIARKYAYKAAEVRKKYSPDIVYRKWEKAIDKSIAEFRRKDAKSWY